MATDYYLKIGGLVIHADGVTTDYRVVGTRNSLIEPRLERSVADALASGGNVAESHEPAERSLRIAVEGDDSDDVLTNAIALRNELVPGAVITWRPSTDSDTRYTTLRYATMTEANVAPITREAGTSYFDVEMTTDPYWYGDETTLVNASTADLPATFDLVSPGGDMPALTQVKITCAQATSFIACGINDSQDSDPTQDYQGDTTHSTATESGESATLTMGSSYATIGTPTDLDAVTDEGRWRMYARVTQDDATASDTSFRHIASVDGSGVSDTVTVNGDDVPATTDYASDGYEWLDLGTASVPPADVPALATGSGYGALTALEDTAVTAAGGDTFNSVSSGSTHYIGVSQSLTLTSGDRVENIDLTAEVILPSDTYWDNDDWGLWVYAADGSGCPTGSLLAYGTGLTLTGYGVGSPGVNTLTLDTPWDVPSDAEYCFLIINSTGTASGSLTLSLDTTNAYADGSVCYLSGAGPLAYTAANSLYDLDVVVDGRHPLGFDVNLGVQAKNAGADDAWLDLVTPIPEHIGFYCATNSFSANQGVLIDEYDNAGGSDAYLTTSTDGTAGGSMLWRSSAVSTERRGEMKVPPKASRLFVTAGTPGTAAPGNCTVTVNARPRWRLT